MRLGLLVKGVLQKLRLYTEVNMAEAIAKFEAKYGEKCAAWAIVAIVAYLFIAR
jgi:hypothetical protein